MIQTIHIYTTVEHLRVAGAKRSKFKTLEKWLLNICEGRKPEKLISDYRINLSFSDSASSRKYTIHLYGENTYPDENITRIDFEPSNMFLELPKQEYKNLDHEKVKKKIMCQLKDFTKTEKFKTSFLSNANITIGFSGEIIWQKQFSIRYGERLDTTRLIDLCKIILPYN